MRLSATRHLKVNLGNYESYDFSGTATVDHGDLGYTDQEVQEQAKKEGAAFRKKLSEEIRDEIDRLIDLLILEDIETSREITEEDKSVVIRAFIHRDPSHRPDNPPPPAANRSTTNQRRVSRGNTNTRRPSASTSR